MRRPEIYFQRQVGGNCRLHALNGYFGYEKISPQQWSQYMSDYDDMSKKRYNSTISCRQYDLINSGGQTIINWILTLHGVYAKYVPFSVVSQNSATNDYAVEIDITGRGSEWIFLFNSNHIWGIRYYNPYKQWFKVDSISGISSFDINSITNGQFKDGLIIPMKPQQEFVKLGSMIADVVRDDGPNEYIRNSIHIGETLGELEVLIANAFACLDAQLHRNLNDKAFDNIRIFVDNWYAFLSIWTDGNYNDVKLTLSHIPKFIATIINIC